MQTDRQTERSHHICESGKGKNMLQLINVKLTSCKIQVFEHLDIKPLH
jgi:hypothetical protein